MLSNDYVPGAPSWLDLGSRDIQAAAAFYTAVFGWRFESAGPEAGGYGFFQLDGETVAALGPLDEDAKSAWTVYFHTTDADATTKAVEQAGGTVRFPAAEVAGESRFAGYTDPDGAEFAVFEPKRTKGLDRVGSLGGLCWTELTTTDGPAAKRFYGSVFGWDYEDMPLPEDSGAGVYIVASPTGGGQAQSHAGLMQLGTDMLPAGSAYWQPYFAVDDCDGVVARTSAGGGSVVVPATDMAGVGRMALLRDPEEAFFAVLDPLPPTI
jgi:predicted enzyme related to lactoylglutathione lyase